MLYIITSFILYLSVRKTYVLVFIKYTTWNRIQVRLNFCFK